VANKNFTVKNGLEVGGQEVISSSGVVTSAALGGQVLGTSSSPSFANITTAGYLRGPASFVIDPAAHGNDTGTVVIAGNLQVDGTQTTINSTTMTVDDLNITLASGAANAAAANGAGITVDGASATLTYNSTGDKFVFNKTLDASSILTASMTVTSTSSSAIYLGGNGAGLYLAGTNNTITGTGNLTLDVAGEIILDADDGIIRVRDDGGDYGMFQISNSDFIIRSMVSDKDLVFKGNDNGSVFTALTLDMSDGGTGSFNSHIRLGDNKTASFGAGFDIEITSDGTNGTIGAPNGNLTLDVAGDIVLDADGGDILLKDGGTHWASLYTNGTNTYIQNMVNSGDVYLSGKDGSGNGVNALILDMSNAGRAIFNAGATFNDHVYFGDNDKAVFGGGDDLQIYHDGSDSFIDDAGTGALAIRSNSINLQKYTGETMAVFTADSSVQLNYDNGKRLETTSTGIDVTGTVTSTKYWLNNTVGANKQFLNSGSTGTGANYLNINSSGGAYYLGAENSAGTELGASAYDFVMQAPSANAINLMVGAGRARLTSTGIDVTGSVVADGITVGSDPLSGDLVSFGSTSSSQDVLSLYSNTPSSGTTLKVYQDHNASTGEAVYIQNDGTGNSLRIREDTNDVFVVKAGGNVNIPNGGLMVGATTAPEGQLTLQNDDASLRIRSNTTTTKGLTLKYNHAGNFGQLLVDHQGNNQLDMKYYALSHTFGRSDSLQFMTINSSGNATFSGSVTAQTLTATNGSLYLDDNGSHNGIINVPATLFINIDSDNNSTGEDFIIAKDRSGSSGGTELFRIDSTGNVGLGVVPSATGAYIQSLQIGEQANLYAHTPGVGAGSSTYLTNNITNNSGAKYIKSDAGSEYVQQSGNHTWWSYPSGTAGASATATQRMVITAAGKVFIGDTTASNAQLRVKQSTNASWAVNIINHQSVAYGLSIDTSASSAYTVYNFAAYTPLGSGFFVKNSGNVGIGVTDPDTKLEVKGTSAAPSATAQILSVTNTTGGTRLDLGVAENSYGWIQAREGSTLRNLLLNSAGGNVGIGTETPSHKLHVKNDNDYAAKFGGTGGGDYSIEIGQGTTNSSAGFNATGTSGSMLFKISDSEKMRIKYDGNVGIGVNNPAYLLHTENLTATAPSYIVTSANGAFLMAMGSQNSPGVAQEAFIGTLSDTRFKIKVNNTVKGSWTGNGLAIGTQSSAYTNLDVAGNIAMSVGNAHAVFSSDTSGKIFIKANENKVNAATAIHMQMPIVSGSGTLEDKLVINHSDITAYKHFLPNSDNTYDLGTASKRWRNIYTGDLHLSNEGQEEGNSVDGTKGNWTIQEGEEHLYIINNKSGKKYKFALEEIE